MSEEKQGMDRRQFLRRAAVTAAAAAGAAPVIQTVTASPAFAGTPELCDHSGCIGACAGTAGGKANCGGPPGQVCQDLCGELFNCGEGGQQCSTTAACVPGNWFHCVFTG